MGESQESNEAAAANEVREVVIDMAVVCDGVNAETVCYDAAGKVIPTPARIVVTPRFFRSEDPANLAYFKVYSRSRSSEEVEELGLPILQIVGATGRFRISDRRVPVSPKFLRSKQPLTEAQQSELQKRRGRDSVGRASGESGNLAADVAVAAENKSR